MTDEAILSTDQEWSSMSTELPQDTGATFWYVRTREEPAGIRHDSQKGVSKLFVSKLKRYDGMTTEETACPDVF